MSALLVPSSSTPLLLHPVDFTTLRFAPIPIFSLSAFQPFSLSLSPSRLLDHVLQRDRRPGSAFALVRRRHKGKNLDRVLGSDGRHQRSDKGQQLRHALGIGYSPALCDDGL